MSGAARRGGVASELFVDASAWYPIALRRHPDHGRVGAVFVERIGGGSRIVTTNLVLAEAHALVATRVGAAAALAFLRAARQRPTDVVTSTPELEAQAEALWLARYRDHRFSLADAVSFTVMAQRGITEALTLDRHFLAAGFVTLPAAP